MGEKQKGSDPRPALAGSGGLSGGAGTGAAAPGIISASPVHTLFSDAAEQPANPGKLSPQDENRLRAATATIHRRVRAEQIRILIFRTCIVTAIAVLVIAAIADMRGAALQRNKYGRSCTASPAP
jgi:hypothetical protein